MRVTPTPDTSGPPVGATALSGGYLTEPEGSPKSRSCGDLVEAVRHCSSLVRSLSDFLRSFRTVQDNPLSTRPVLGARMPTCHGCHGRMGEGQHQGSVAGKLHCTLPHAFYCRGNVIEDNIQDMCMTRMLSYQKAPVWNQH